MSEPVEHLLERLVTLLAAANELSWRSTMEALLAEMQGTHDDVQYQHVLRRILRLYRGGMGSFEDLVLQADGCVLPEQPEFDIARESLFHAAREQLR